MGMIGACCAPISWICWKDLARAAASVDLRSAAIAVSTCGLLKWSLRKVSGDVP
jgi:hypothetical protein